METWWSALSDLQQVAWVIAILSSTIFFTQTVLTFFGMDSGIEFNHDVDTSAADFNTPFQLFTFRNLVNFLLGTSWSVILLYDTIDSKVILPIVGVVIGILLVAAVMWIFYLMSKMEQNGTASLDECIGHVASVYLVIPENKKGMGKVQLTLRNSVREFDAITLGKKLTTGSIVKVIGVANEHTLIVE